MDEWGRDDQNGGKNESQQGRPHLHCSEKSGAGKKSLGTCAGKKAPDDEYIDEPEKIKVARYWVGEIGFELMESTAPDGEVADFIEKKGEGIMLISLNVDSTRAAMEELGAKGYPFIGVARPFRDCEFTFVHPGKWLTSLE